MKELLICLEKIDWANLKTVFYETQKLLLTLSNDRKLLKELLVKASGNKEYVSLSEHYDFFDKLVLYNDELDRFRIRIHVFSELSHKLRPHNHRWNYSSVILRGKLIHSIYGTTNNINEETSPSELKPNSISIFDEGSIYSLSSNVFHSIDAEPNTVSLFIRGQPYTDKFLVMDKKSNSSWWEYSRDCETIEEVERKKMSINKYNQIINKLHSWNII